MAIPYQNYEDTETYDEVLVHYGSRFIYENFNWPVKFRIYANEHNNSIKPAFNFYFLGPSKLLLGRGHGKTYPGLLQKFKMESFVTMFNG